MKNIAKILCFVLSLVLVISVMGVATFADETTGTPTGTLSAAFTNGNTIWGECGGNASESFVIKVYSDDQYLGSASLNDVDGIFDGDVYVTWSINFAGKSSKYWTVEWLLNPSDYMPATRVEQWVDGVMVAEAPVQLNNPDGVGKIVAAAVDIDGYIISYYTSVADAIADGKSNRILLLADSQANIDSFNGVELYTTLDSVTLTSTYTDNYVDFDNVTIGYGVTLNVNSLYTGGSENAIEGTLNVAGDYLHGYDANTYIGGVVNVGGELVLTEYTDMYLGINLYGTLNCGSITVNSGAITGYFATVTADKFVANEAYGIYVALEESTVVINDATVNAELDFKAVDNGDGTYSLVTKQYVAEVDGVKYEDFFQALKAIKAGSYFNLQSDFTYEGDWDPRKNGAKVSVPFTFDGNEHTIKIVGKMTDPNYCAPFRFEADVYMSNLTLDLSEATNVHRAISAKYGIVLENCTFIGNDSAKRGVIFGEGAGAAISSVVVRITDCTFENWGYGVCDNMNAQDAQSVIVTGSNFYDASVLLSASDFVIFTENTISDGGLNIKSYSGDILDVTVLDNYLDESYVNIVDAFSGSVQAGIRVKNPGTPTIGANGNWIVGNIDTGYKATPTVTVEDGCWVINGLPTYVPAIAENGVSSTVNIGDDGFWYINDVNTKIKAQAVDGVGVVKIEKNDTLSDSYSTTYDIILTNGEKMSFTVQNGINGNQGKPGDIGPSGNPGEKGDMGIAGYDGYNGSDVVMIAIVVGGACALIALVVLGIRVFKKDPYLLKF